MKSIISEILIDHEDKINENARYKRMCDMAELLTEQLVKGLEAGQIDLLKQLSDAHTAQMCESNEEYFKEGFKMGVLLGLELCKD